jgi:hypothetical protein
VSRKFPVDYYEVPRTLSKLRLNVYERSVLTEILSYYPQMFPSIPTIAAGCRISRATCFKSLSSLKKKGILTSQRRFNYSSLFEINWSAFKDPKVDVTPAKPLKKRATASVSETFQKCLEVVESKAPEAAVKSNCTGCEYGYRPGLINPYQCTCGGIRIEL